MDTLLEADLRPVSRRGFLKLAGSSLLALFTLPALRQQPTGILAASSSEASSLGRVVNNRTALRKKPSFNGDIIKLYKVDEVIPISGATLGEDNTDYNRIWYQVNNGDGFVYSGGVQPVEVISNSVIQYIPSDGLLAEVTVPYTIARWGYSDAAHSVYRLYYGTTHWVTDAKQDEKGKWWYAILDDKKGYTYYVNAAHLRMFNSEELTPLSPNVPMDEKRIEIRLKEQVIVAFEGDRAVFMARTATGAHFSDGDYRTAPGDYLTNRKRPSRHMAAGEPGIGTGFDLPGVPWVCYLTKTGVSIHGTYWHNDFGRPRSHGCINLSPTAARWIYRWTAPLVPPGQQTVEEKTGTQVKIL